MEERMDSQGRRASDQRPWYSGFRLRFADIITIGLLVYNLGVTVTRMNYVERRQQEMTIEFAIHREKMDERLRILESKEFPTRIGYIEATLMAIEKKLVKIEDRIITNGR
jgi:hypothetical protein